MNNRNLWSRVTQMTLGIGIICSIVVIHRKCQRAAENKYITTLSDNTLVGEEALISPAQWTELFHFVPNNVHDCSELFDGDVSLPKSFIEQQEKFEAIFQQQIQITPWNEKAGYMAMFPFIYKMAVTIASFPFVNTICETGFNTGHSTFGWLQINPKAKVYSFDKGRYDYNRPMAVHLQKLFPGRLNVTWGDSRSTLQDFHREHPEVKCDLIIIDGGHTFDVASADLQNFKTMANKQNLILMDDYYEKVPLTGIGKVWDTAKRQGDVAEIFTCTIKHGFAVGRIVV